MSQQLLFDHLPQIVTTTATTTVLTVTASGTLTNPQVITSTHVLTAQ